MRAVMLPIHPEWCEKIISGEKTIEIRKTRPKLGTPFKCYIYCTSDTGKHTLNTPISQQRIMEHYAETGSMVSLNCPIGNKKVIGEFICKNVDNHCGVELIIKEDAERTLAGSCLTRGQVLKYLMGTKIVGCYNDLPDFYGWHISDLVIYDKPKELSEFRTLDTREK